MEADESALSGRTATVTGPASVYLGVPVLTADRTKVYQVDVLGLETALGWMREVAGAEQEAAGRRRRPPCRQGRRPDAKGRGRRRADWRRPHRSCYPPGMDVGILGIVGSVIGTGLAVVIAIVGLGWRATTRLEARLDRRMDRIEDNLGARMDRMEDAHRTDTARLEDAHRTDTARLEEAHRADTARMEEARRADTARVEERLARVEHGQAKLEGLLEGLREAIAGRRAA